MKYLNSYKIFEYNSEDIIKDLEDIFLEVSDEGLWKVTIEYNKTYQTPSFEYSVRIEPNLSGESKDEYVESGRKIEISKIIEPVERAKDYLKMDLRISTNDDFGYEQIIDLSYLRDFAYEIYADEYILILFK